MASGFQDISDTLQRCETAEVRDFIASLRERVSDLREENSDLKDELKALKEKLEEKAKLVYESPFYWMVDNDEKDGPFCQQCWDNNKKKIRLQDCGNDFWICKTCKSDFKGEGYISRAIAFSNF